METRAKISSRWVNGEKEPLAHKTNFGVSEQEHVATASVEYTDRKGLVTTVNTILIVPDKS